MMSVTVKNEDLREHEYTLATLNGLYLVLSVPIMFVMVFGRIYIIPLTVCCLGTLFGILGTFILHQRKSNLMNIYRKILIGVLGLQIFAFISTLVILLFRSYIAESFLQHFIQEYHNDASNKDVMDKVQLNFECCGIQSYKDWSWSSSLPLSCCGTSMPPCTVATTKLIGCKENLGMYILLICLAFLFVSTGNIILHAYCIRCAFELSKEYQRYPRNKL